MDSYCSGPFLMGSCPAEDEPENLVDIPQGFITEWVAMFFEYFEGDAPGCA